MRAAPLYRDRTDAGQVLGREVARSVSDPDALVLALPRGGVPVGYEVARAIGAELDIFLVRKLGLPGHEELAIGAIASGGVRVLNEDLVREVHLSSSIIDALTAREQQELERRERLYRAGRPAQSVEDRTVILVDDGLATGATMLAAARAVRRLGPKQIVVAVPVASPEACEEFRAHVDQIVCAATPHPFYAVGAWYQNFNQTSDEEVQSLLAQFVQ